MTGKACPPEYYQILIVTSDIYQYLSPALGESRNNIIEQGTMLCQPEHTIGHSTFAG